MISGSPGRGAALGRRRRVTPWRTAPATAADAVGGSGAAWAIAGGVAFGGAAGARGRSIAGQAQEDRNRERGRDAERRRPPPQPVAGRRGAVDPGAHARREAGRRVDGNRTPELGFEILDRAAPGLERRRTARAGIEVGSRGGSQIRAAGVVLYGLGVGFTRHCSL
jgi:hypothetical protein